MQTSVYLLLFLLDLTAQHYQPSHKCNSLEGQDGKEELLNPRHDFSSNLNGVDVMGLEWWVIDGKDIENDVLDTTERVKIEKRGGSLVQVSPVL